MAVKQFILAIDQGTTSSRAILFDSSGSVAGLAQRPIPVTYPHPGWVNQNATDIWMITEAVCREAIASAGAKPSQIVAIGITNQRETTVLWDRRTGEPLAPAIVWQSRQSADVIRSMERRGVAEKYRAITGLVLDPYFSASKIRWLLDQDPALESRSKRGDVCFGTVDSWLIWNLTGGEHLSDATNAARTLLFDIHGCEWSDELLADLDIPKQMMPRVVSNSGEFARAGDAFGNAPIAGSAGDQHAALFGQACFASGQAKNTYGTGSFALLNTGDQVVASNNGLLSTLAWVISDRATYALEGSVLVSGSAVQWLRDELGIIASAAEIETLAGSVPDTGGVVFVPALAGLGAPDWDDAARGLIIGITRGTNRAHIARATIEAIAFQVADVLDAMTGDSAIPVQELKVDGGAAQNDMLLQFQADLLGVPVIRSAVQETTALGAAYLAGLGIGMWNDLAEISGMWRADRQFEPAMSADERSSRTATWRRAVDRSRSWVVDGAKQT